MSAPRTDADEEGAQRTRRFRRGPGRLNQHGAGMAAAGLADPAMAGGSQAGLADAWVQPEIAHQFLRRLEPLDAADRRHQPCRHSQVDAGDGQEALDGFVVQGVLGDVAVELGKIFPEPVELADMTRNRGPFILRNRLAGQPVAAALVEEIGIRALRDQMRMQDGMHLVLDPGPVPDNLIAARHQPAHPLRRRIRGPDFRQVAGRMQAGQRPGVDLAGLHMGMGDRLDLKRIGNHHPLHIGRQDPGHRHAVSGRLDHHFIRLLQLPAEPLQGGSGHLDPAFVTGQAILPDHHLPEGAVDIDANHASHGRFPCQ